MAKSLDNTKASVHTTFEQNLTDSSTNLQAIKASPVFANYYLAGEPSLSALLDQHLELTNRISKILADINGKPRK